MRNNKPVNSSESPRKVRPALSPESRENQLISLATDLVEKRLIEGTASAQETTHFLKLATSKYVVEKEILENKKELIKAQTQSLQSSQKIEELYTNALNAMKSYSGQSEEDND